MGSNAVAFVHPSAVCLFPLLTLEQSDL